MTSEPLTEALTLRPGDRWRQGLRHTAPPQALVDAAPARRQFLEPERFRWRPELDGFQPPRPSHLRAAEALPQGGTVIDVGVGGGRGSLGLSGAAGLIIGVDPSEDMLASFTASARILGVASRAVLGSWPEIGAEVEAVDVVVSHNTVYGVEEIEAFLDALTTHARHRVVIEVSNEPPPPGMAPLWKAIHGFDRATRPVADDLEGVLEAMGLAVERKDWLFVPPEPEVTSETVAFMRRRLLVDKDRDAEIADLMRTLPRSGHTRVALWWPGTG